MAGNYLVEHPLDSSYAGGHADLMDASNTTSIYQIYDSSLEENVNDEYQTAAANIATNDGVVFIMGQKDDDGLWNWLPTGADDDDFDITYRTNYTEFVFEYTEAEINGLKERFGYYTYDEGLGLYGTAFYDTGWDSDDSAYSNPQSGYLQNRLEGVVGDILASLYANKYTFKQSDATGFKPDMISPFGAEEGVQDVEVEAVATKAYDMS